MLLNPVMVAICELALCFNMGVNIVMDNLLFESLPIVIIVCADDTWKSPSL